MTSDHAPSTTEGSYNPFTDEETAAHDEEWYAGQGHDADIREKWLLKTVLTGMQESGSVLEVGAGTGHFCRWLRELGYQAVGVDSSQAMLVEARRRNSTTYLEADGHALPFADGAFDVTALITTLEFTADPECVLREAVRIARYGVLMGVLNRCSLLTRRYRRSGKPVWQYARFYSPGELKRMLVVATGRRLIRVRWATTLWPLPWIGSLPLPWGGFIGMAAELQPAGGCLSAASGGVLR